MHTRSRGEAMKQLGPMGFLEEKKSSVSPEVLAKLVRIEQEDLRFERKTVVSKGRCSALAADTLERELKRFFSLGVLLTAPSYPLAPSEVVDALWHRFILNTPKYRSFCDDVFGYYFDHAPEADRSAGLAKYSGEIAGYTKGKLTEYYGILPSFIWGVEAGCDHVAPCITPLP